MRVLLLATIFATGCSPLLGTFGGTCALEFGGVEILTSNFSIDIQSDTRGALLGDAVLEGTNEGSFSGAVVGDGFSGVATWINPSTIITFNATPDDSGDILTGDCSMSGIPASGTLLLTRE